MTYSAVTLFCYLELTYYKDELPDMRMSVDGSRAPNVNNLFLLRVLMYIAIVT